MAEEPVNRRRPRVEAFSVLRPPAASVQSDLAAMEESKIPAARAYARNIRMMNPRHAAEANMDVDSALPAPAAAGGVAPMTTSDAPAPEMTRSPETLALLKAGGEVVQAKMMHDERHDDVLAKLSSSSSGYYSFDKQRMRETRRIELPQAILNQFDHLWCKSFMGLFPDICRAFITVDNQIFLWNYHDGRDFYLYDELDQVIVSAALVRPKPGVFVEEIKYLLVLATPVEIVILGVAFDNDNVYNELQIYPTQFSVPSDNVHMLKIIGTPEGRIFMCGKDGNVYELHYQATDGWFSRKCRKLNHSSSTVSALLPGFIFGASDDPIIDICVDPSRAGYPLYTLSRRGEIRVYLLGPGGAASSLTRKSSLHSPLAEARRLLKLKDVKREDWDHKTFQLVSISPIQVSESLDVCLIAVTNHGHRLFFAYEDYEFIVKFVRECPPDIGPASHMAGRPGALQAARPPQFVHDKSPKLVQRSFYHQGVTLYADRRSTEGDVLVALNNDAASSAAGGLLALNESVESVSMARSSRPGVDVVAGARIFDMAEMPSVFYMSLVASFLYAKDLNAPLSGLSEFATQHALPPRQFLVLTNTGVRIFRRSYPVDDLREVLAKRVNDAQVGIQELQNFFRQYGVQESCAMALIVACKGYAEGVSLYDQAHSRTPNRSMNGGLNGSSVFSDYRGAGNSSTPLPAGRMNGAATPAPLTSGSNTSKGGRTPLGDTSAIGYDANASMLAPNYYAPARLTNDQLESAATEVFFEYGAIDAEGKNDAIELGLQLRRPGHTHGMGRAVQLPDHFISGRCDGLWLYLARLLRPIWRWSMIVASESGVPEMRFTSQQLLEMQTPMIRLRQFLQSHKARFAPVPDDSFRAPDLSEERRRAMLQQKEAVEKDKLRQLDVLLDMCIEAFSVMIIFAENPVVLSNLKERDIVTLMDLEFGDLATTKDGETVAWTLINALTRDITDTRWVDRLHRECPHFFGDSDMLRFKALENLNLARKSHPVRDDVKRYLDRALEYYRKSSVYATFPLRDACKQLRSVHAYSAVVELCLLRLTNARKLTDLPLDALDNIRQECYDQIFLTLDSLFVARYPPDEAPDQSSDRLALDESERARLMQETIRMALKSDDEEFHQKLYRWFIDRNLKERLYDIPREKSSFLVRYLTNTEELVLFLRDYYLRHRMWGPAAILLSELSKKVTAEYTLNDRLGFLNTAFTCAKNLSTDDGNVSLPGMRRLIEGPGAGGDGTDMVVSELVINLRERIDLAKLQLQLLNRLETAAQSADVDDQKREACRQAVSELNSQLLDLDQMYSIANQLQVHESCLEVLRHSEFNQNPELIKQLWQNMIRRAFAARQWNEQWAHYFASVGRQYVDVDFMFPLPTIIDTLETLNAKFFITYRMTPRVNDPRTALPVDTLLQMGVPIDVLLQEYRHVIQTMGAKSQEEQALIYCSLYHLLRSEQAQNSSFNGEVDMINEAVTELQRMTLPLATEVHAALRSLQGRVQFAPSARRRY